MNKIALCIGASLLMLASATSAQTAGNNGGGNGGCGVGQQTNGCGGSTGTGGDGGTGGAGGASSATNNTDVEIDNRFSATNHNVVSNRNDNTNINANVNSNDVRSNSVSAASSNQAQSQSTSNSNNSSINVEGDRFVASTAYAAPLAVSSDTCMGSTSAGGQGMAFGFSFGTSWTDKNCVRLKNARQMQTLGYSEAAKQLMCQNADVRKAMKDAGTPCEVAIVGKP